jgi:hypothetical protein
MHDLVAHKLVAVFRAALAQHRAHGADAAVFIGASEHEVSRCLADVRAIGEERYVSFLGVTAALLQAIGLCG